MKKYYMAVKTGCTSYHLLLNNYLPGNFRLLLLHSLSGRRASGSSRSCCSQYLAVFLTVEREKNCVLSSNALATFRELVLTNWTSPRACWAIYIGPKKEVGKGLSWDVFLLSCSYVHDHLLLPLYYEFVIVWLTGWSIPLACLVGCVLYPSKVASDRSRWQLTSSSNTLNSFPGFIPVQTSGQES